MAADPKTALINAMDEAHITDPQVRAGIAAITGGESGFVPHPETGYAHTHDARIRQIFQRIAGLSDAQLDQLKASDRAFFDTVYGGEWGARHLGNTQPEDGYTYRGRGYFQLTGRANYERYGKLLGIDLLGNPDLADDPEIAAKIAVAYIQERYHGGGFEAMKQCVGMSVAGVSETKDKLYAEFLASGEFAVGQA